MMNKNEAIILETLVYYDGPQVLLLETKERRKIIAVAFEKEGYNYPFLGAEINEYQWEKYCNKQVDLRYLLVSPYWKNWYIIDLKYGPVKDTVELRKATKEEYKNEKFLPSAGCYSF